MVISPAGVPEIQGNRLETVIMNASMPTVGSFMRGRELQGYLDLTSLAGGIYLFYQENEEYHDLKDRYDILTSYLQEGGISDSRELRRQAHRAYIYADRQDSYRKNLLLFTSAIYLYQIIEPLFLDAPPSYRQADDKPGIIFSGTEKSTARAFLYSLLKPGRGQYYQGKKRRGTFFSAMTVLAGYIALDQNNQYNRKMDDYDICLDEYSSAVTIGEKREYLRRAAILREDAEDAGDNRDLSLYILAGIWGVNLLDTLLFECHGEECEYSINITPGRFELAYSF
jgi:hypothetical protein